MRKSIITTLLVTGIVGCELTDTTQHSLEIEPGAKLLDGTEEPVSEIREEVLVSQTPKVDIAWDVVPSDAEIPNATLELSGTLQRLHTTTLTAFESAPSFGNQRM